MSAPYQAVRCADGHLVIGAANQKLWISLCEVIGRLDLVEDSRFLTNTDRLQNREALIEEIEKESDAALKRGMDRCVACGGCAGRADLRLCAGPPERAGECTSNGDGDGASCRRHYQGAGLSSEDERDAAGSKIPATAVGATYGGCINRARLQFPESSGTAQEGSVRIMTGAVHFKRDGAIAHVIFDRPEARNAMTWAMYESSIASASRSEPSLAFALPRSGVLASPSSQELIFNSSSTSSLEKTASTTSVASRSFWPVSIGCRVRRSRSSTDGVWAADWPCRHAVICALRRQQRHLVFPSRALSETACPSAITHALLPN